MATDLYALIQYPLLELCHLTSLVPTGLQRCTLPPPSPQPAAPHRKMVADGALGLPVQGRPVEEPMSQWQNSVEVGFCFWQKGSRRRDKFAMGQKVKISVRRARTYKPHKASKFDIDAYTYIDIECRYAYIYIHVYTCICIYTYMYIRVYLYTSINTLSIYD